MNTDELERLMREAIAFVRLGPLTKHEHQELDSLMTRAVNALPELLAEYAKLRERNAPPADGAGEGEEALEYMRPEVRAFARHMENALRRKDSERGGNSWQKYTPPDEILPHLQERVERIEGYLKTANRFRQDDMIEQMHLDNAAEQAVHVANFAMMIADICYPLARATHKDTP